MATLTITATARPDLSVPAVRVIVTDSGSPAVVSVIVLRVGPDGATTPVRTFDGAPAQFSGGTLTVWDYEAPFGVPVSYTTDRAGSPASAPVTLDVGDVWLIHPGKPLLSVSVRFAEMGPRTRAVAEGAFEILRRRFPIVITDGQRKAPVGSAVLRTDLNVDRLAMEALLDDAAPLFLNVPAGMDWGLATEFWAVSGVAEGRVVRHGPHPMRTWAFDYRVIDRPVGGMQGPVTWVDVAAEYPTWDSIPAGTTWAQLAEPS